MFTKLLNLLLPIVFNYRDIADPKEGLYLRRYFISGPAARFFRSRRQRFLHYIARPDKDRVPHDHPWDFDTTVLSGGYVEKFYKPGEAQWAGLGFMGRMPADLQPVEGARSAFRAATYVHRITRVMPDTWTWVVTSGERRKWGFWVPDEGSPTGARWVYWKTYLGIRDDGRETPEDA